MNHEEAWSEWMETLKQGNLDAFKQRLDKGLNPIQPPSEGQFQHWPALAEALAQNQVEIGQLLIHWCQSNAPHHLSHWRCYAEGRHHSYHHLAARFFCPNLIQPLVDAGLEIDCESLGGWPAVWLCGEETFFKREDSLFQQKAMTTFSAFVKAGANTAKRLQCGWTMGDYAFGQVSPAFFEFLLNTAYSSSWARDLQNTFKESQTRQDIHALLKRPILEAFYIHQERQKLASNLPQNSIAPIKPRI